jgi:hypothetical protein
MRLIITARRKTIVISAYLIQAASNSPINVSALESSISALESAISALESEIKALEISSAPLEWYLSGATAVVVLGLLMEYWVVWRERLDDKDAFALGIVRLADWPSTRKYVVELISISFITLGVLGEFAIGITITSDNGILRGKSAELRSKNAELRSRSDQLVELLHKQSAELEAKVAWRRLPKEQQSVIAAHLKQFSVIRVGISYLGGIPEASQFADDIAAALHAAQWNKQPLEPFSLFGGYGGGVYPLHPSTGVNVSTTGEKGRNASEALQRELCSIGFDTTVTPTPPVTKTDGTKPKIDVVVLVVARPIAPQGEAKLTIDAKTKTCTSSE